MAIDIHIPTLHQIGPLLKDLYSVPISSGIKDSKGQYLSCSQLTADYVGKESPNEVEGHFDLDLTWKENHLLYRHNDKTVETKQKPLFFIEPARNTNNEIVHLLSIKAPLTRYIDNVPGIIGACVPLNERSYQTILFNVIKVLEILHLKFEDQVVFQTVLKAMNINQAGKQWRKDSIPFDYGVVVFTLREAQCLHYFLKRYSAQKTAEKLFLSPKTVEFYLAEIKNKLNCNNTSEIIELAMEYGFIDLVFMQF